MPSQDLCDRASSLVPPSPLLSRVLTVENHDDAHLDTLETLRHRAPAGPRSPPTALTRTPAPS